MIADRRVSWEKKRRAQVEYHKGRTNTQSWTFTARERKLKGQDRQNGRNKLEKAAAEQGKDLDL